MKLKIAAVMLSLLPFLLYAQYNTIHLQPNTRYSKTSDVAATTQMNLYGQNYVYAVTANIKTDYDIIEKTANGYQVQITLDAINSELSSNGVKMSFNSQKDTLANMEDTVFAKPLSDILGETDNVVVDSAGSILQSDTSQTHRKAAEYVTSTLLFGNDYSIGKKLDIIFHFKDSVKVGTTWIDSVSTKDGFKIDTFSVEKIVNKIITVVVKGKVSRTLPVQQGTTTAMAHFSGNTNTVLQIAESTGIIYSRKMQTNIQSHINVNGADIPISSQIQLNEVVQ